MLVARRFADMDGRTSRRRVRGVGREPKASATPRTPGTSGAVAETRRMTGTSETITVLGRQFVLAVTGPTARGRFEVRVAEPGRDPPFTPPVVGMTPREAHDRAVEVLRYLVGVERLRRLAEAAAEALPGAVVAIVERAGDVRVELEGRWRLREAVVVALDDLVEATDGEMAERLGDHFRRHATTAGTRDSGLGRN